MQTDNFFLEGNSQSESKEEIKSSGQDHLALSMKQDNVEENKIRSLLNLVTGKVFNSSLSFKSLNYSLILV